MRILSGGGRAILPDAGVVGTLTGLGLPVIEAALRSAAMRLLATRCATDVAAAHEARMEGSGVGLRVRIASMALQAHQRSVAAPAARLTRAGGADRAYSSMPSRCGETRER